VGGTLRLIPFTARQTIYHLLFTIYRFATQQPSNLKPSNWQPPRPKLQQPSHWATTTVGAGNPSPFNCAPVGTPPLQPGSRCLVLLRIAEGVNETEGASDW